MYLHLPSAACPSCHCGGGYRAAESRVHPLRLPWQPRILRLQYQNRWHRNAENHYHQAYTEGFAVFIFVSSRQTHGKYRSLIICSSVNVSITLPIGILHLHNHFRLWYAASASIRAFFFGRLTSIVSPSAMTEFPFTAVT